MIRIEQGDDGEALISAKAVPGASRDAIAGALGDRLKIKVSAPAEGGKANRAIAALIAAALDLKPRDVRIAHGAASPEKVIAVRGRTPEEIRARLEA